MKKTILKALWLFIPLLSGCEIIEYHPYEARITGSTDINKKNIERIERSLAGYKTFRFAMISDTQRRYDETQKMVKELNKRDDIAFVLHGGDIADFGETKEFLWARDVLSRLRVPYVCLLGNHDCLATGLDVFQKVFGKENFAFTAGNVRIVCLNTNALEFDYSDPVPDFNFLENEITHFPSTAQKTIVAMHTPPNDCEFNNNVVKPFQRYLHQFPKLQFCLYGHNHRFAAEDMFGDGVVYYGCTSADRKGYYIITINEEGYEVERCYF